MQFCLFTCIHTVTMMPCPIRAVNCPLYLHSLFSREACHRRPLRGSDEDLRPLSPASRGPPARTRSGASCRGENDTTVPGQAGSFEVQAGERRRFSLSTVFCAKIPPVTA